MTSTQPFVIRPAQGDDLQALYEMAKLTGGGFTNLPPDRPSLRAKLDRSAAAFARDDDTPTDEAFVLVLENTATGEVRGTCQIFTQVGQRWPFYSYRIATVTKHSEALNRTFRAEILNLVNDLEGCSEVGGLFLHPGERAGGLGLLLARSRYLFIRAHRARFADRVLAELRLMKEAMDLQGLDSQCATSESKANVIEHELATCTGIRVSKLREKSDQGPAGCQ